MVLRFSIVAPKVPFLVSKFVFKRLGGALDLDANTLVLKRLDEAKEPLYDLMSGHVGIELVRDGLRPPKVSDSTMQCCIDGDEVTVENVEHRKQLANLYPRDHGTHMVTLPLEVSYNKVRFDGPETEHEEVSGAEEQSDFDEIESHVLEGIASSSAHVMHRARAAAFYREEAPGWRSRARDILVPYRRRKHVMDKHGARFDWHIYTLSKFIRGYW